MNGGLDGVKDALLELKDRKTEEKQKVNGSYRGDDECYYRRIGYDELHDAATVAFARRCIRTEKLGHGRT